MVVYAGVEGGGTSWRVAIAEGHPTNITESKVKKHRVTDRQCCFRLAPIDQPGHVHLDQLECARDAPKGVKPPLQESRLPHPVVFIVFHPPSFIPCADERAIEALALCTKRASIVLLLSFAVFYYFSQSFPTYPDSQRQLQEIKDWLSTRYYDALGIGTFGPVDPREVCRRRPPKGLDFGQVWRRRIELFLRCRLYSGLMPSGPACWASFCLLRACALSRADSLAQGW